MVDFKKLCEIIIDSNGNPSVQDVLDCGYSMEHFIRLSQSNVNSQKLVQRARENLIEMGIHYKENEL